MNHYILERYVAAAVVVFLAPVFQTKDKKRNLARSGTTTNMCNAEKERPQHAHLVSNSKKREKGHNNQGRNYIVSFFFVLVI